MAQGMIARTAATPTNGTSLGPAVREASVTALVALVLLVPLLGMRTSSGPTGPTLAFHFGWVAVAVAVVFAGRLLLTLARRAPGPLVPPAREGADDGKQVARALRQLVVHARGHLAVALPGQQPVGHHPVEPRPQLLR